MNPVIRKLHDAQLRNDLPEFRPGDTVRVNVRLKEGEGEKEKERLQAFEGVVIIVQRQADLLEVVRTAHAIGGLAHLLHGGEEQTNQDGDDGNHDQQFDEREAASKR